MSRSIVPGNNELQYFKAVRRRVRKRWIYFDLSKLRFAYKHIMHIGYSAVHTQTHRCISESAMSCCAEYLYKKI